MSSQQENGGKDGNTAGEAGTKFPSMEGWQA